MHFCFEHSVPVPREQVFGFFQNPECFDTLYAGWSKIRLLHHQGHVRVGAETWVEAPIAGCVPVVLGFRHMLFESPIRFGEESIHGPFSTFIHIHEFIARDGKTSMRDLLEIRLPRYYGGEMAMQHGVAPIIRRMFHNRAEALLRLADNGSLTNGAGKLELPTHV